MSVNGKSVEDPKLYDLMQSLKSDIFKSFNAVKVGAVQSFDAEKRTATVQVSFKRQLYNGTIESFPILVDCPVFTLHGGGAAVTLPITAGDECLVLFADQNIDAWYANGGQQVPLDLRRHSPADALAVVGLNSLSNPLTAILLDGEAAFTFGTSKVGLMGGKVTVAGTAGTLLLVLDGLIDVLTTLQVTGPLSLTPASIAALNAYKLVLASLLY